MDCAAIGRQLPAFEVLHGAITGFGALQQVFVTVFLRLDFFEAFPIVIFL